MKLPRLKNNTFFNNMNMRYVRVVHRWHPRIVVACSALDIVTFVMSVATLVTLLVWVGYDHAEAETRGMRIILVCAEGLFAFSLFFRLVFNRRATVRGMRWLTWAVDAGILLLLLPTLYPHPQHPWLPFLERFLYSPVLQFGILAAYSVVDISYGIMRVTARRTNPAILLGTSFVILIFSGALVLMMPKCTVSGISFVDSVFTSASAVCITGLTPVDIASTFTPLGQWVLAVLFQLGALGIITFTSFFALFFSGNQSIYSQLLMKDLIYSKTMAALVPTLLYILGFTLVFELVGAVAIYFTIPDTLGMSVGDKTGFAVFQSMSSFCNVGFTNIDGGLSNPAFLYGNQYIYIVVSVMVIAGGIGFPFLVNIKDAIKQYFKRIAAGLRHRTVTYGPKHIYDLNTKVVLTTTAVIFVLGSVAFFFLESGNTMRGMPLYDRVVQSVFNATTPRSSGFASVNPANFLNVTLIIVMVQMWIGGASQSMAGGIKVNTLGTVILNLRSIIRGKKGVVAYGRNLAIPSVRRANAVVTLSLLSAFVFTVIIMVLEPELGARNVIFEVVSAVFTVGTSLGITPELSTASKWVLVVAMFLGRVGLLSLMAGMFTPRHDLSPHFPTENIIIN